MLFLPQIDEITVPKVTAVAVPEIVVEYDAPGTYGPKFIACLWGVLADRAIRAYRLPLTQTHTTEVIA